MNTTSCEIWPADGSEGSADPELTPAGYGGPGFTGSETIVRDAVAKWRKGWIQPVTTLPPDFLSKPLVDALEKYVQLGQSKAHLAVTGDRPDT
ncbi:hypothetical protein [Escherichia coli]|uniref:hypothetical protein n=1 Tax=Escherichia coli TaxID=562 RepID=UPI002157D818|nr:hypothetical protein [Escherichia coli]